MPVPRPPSPLPRGWVGLSRTRRPRCLPATHSMRAQGTTSTSFLWTHHLTRGPGATREHGLASGFVTPIPARPPTLPTNCLNDASFARLPGPGSSVRGRPGRFDTYSLHWTLPMHTATRRDRSKWLIMSISTTSAHAGGDRKQTGLPPKSPRHTSRAREPPPIQGGDGPARCRLLTFGRTRHPFGRRSAWYLKSTRYPIAPIQAPTGPRRQSPRDCVGSKP